MKKSIITISLLFGFSAIADTTIDPAHPYAYGANTGWINARADGTNGAVIGRYFCSGHLYSANLGWISLGAGVPTNGYAYDNTSADDFGVNHDEAGALRGYAYSANTGWIAFEDQGNPRVDLMSGNLSGYAYAANTGWISLSNAQAFVRTERLDAGPDSDADGIPDPWEYGHTNDLAALAGGGADSDSDGVSDVDEYLADTDPVDGNDHLRITEFATVNTTNTVTWNAQATRVYTLKHTPALDKNWTQAAAPFVPSAAEDVTKTVDGTTNHFYRVVAELPLN